MLWVCITDRTKLNTNGSYRRFHSQNTALTRLCMWYVNDLNGRLTGLPVRTLCKQQEIESKTTLSTSIIQVSLLLLLKPMTVRDRCTHSGRFNLPLSPTVHLKKVWQVLSFKLATTLLIKEVKKARKNSFR